MVAKKLKPLRPSLREKKRYVVFEVLSRGSVSESDASNAIWQGCIDLIGQKGASAAGLAILHDRWHQPSQSGIVKVAHTKVDEIKTALALIRQAGQNPAIFRACGVSGMLDKASTGFIKARLISA
ncbi:MAG TPA: Rpp14/Pop5 family protein [Candidatus Nanoarchaeia archaeon]|nr:Rpp14/Pop5 family protein [Candidatus Nanoarchaeia archaeon]